MSGDESNLEKCGYICRYRGQRLVTHCSVQGHAQLTYVFLIRDVQVVTHSLWNSCPTSLQSMLVVSGQLFYVVVSCLNATHYIYTTTAFTSMSISILHRTSASIHHLRNHPSLNFVFYFFIVGPTFVVRCIFAKELTCQDPRWKGELQRSMPEG